MKIWIIASAFFALPCWAFTLNSSSDSNFKGWNNANISFKINTSNCPSNIDIAGLMNTAFQIWNNVATSNIHLSIAGTTSSTSSSTPTTVYCETNFQSVTGADQNYVPAAASLSSSGDYASSGVFYLNVSSGSANISRFDPTKLSIIMAHEIGHILGLGHSQDSAALMYYDATAKTTLNLSQDDVDGVSYLYPRNELNGDKPMGCGLVRGLPPPPPGNAAALLSLLLLPLLSALWLRARALRLETAKT